MRVLGNLICCLMAMLATASATGDEFDNPQSFEPSYTNSDLVRQDITPALVKWKNLFRVLRIRYHYFRAGEDGRPSDRRVHYIEWDYGPRRNSRFHHWVEENGKTVMRELETVERRRQTLSIYPAGESDVDEPSEVRASVNMPLHVKMEIMPLRGLWMAQLERWLPHVFLEYDRYDAEWVDVNQTNCLKVNFAETTDNNTWYLDPSFDYLPRKFVDAAGTTVVDEYQRVNNHTPFPLKGSFQARATSDSAGEAFRWHVDAVELLLESDSSSESDGAGQYEEQSRPGGYQATPSYEDGPPTPSRADHRRGRLRRRAWTAFAAISSAGLAIGLAVWIRRRRARHS